MVVPVIQLVAAFWRQMSRPLAKRIVAYAANHKRLKNYFLVPIGKSLHMLAYRLRLKNFGLLATPNIAPISEERAIDLAVDSLVEVLVYAVTVALIYAIYRSNPEKAKLSDVENYVKENEERIEKFEKRLKHQDELLEKVVKILREKQLDDKHILDEKSKGQFFSMISEKVKQTLSPKAPSSENEGKELSDKPEGRYLLTLFKGRANSSAEKGNEL